MPSTTHSQGGDADRCRAIRTPGGAAGGHPGGVAIADSRAPLRNGARDGESPWRADTLGA